MPPHTTPNQTTPLHTSRGGGVDGGGGGGRCGDVDGGGVGGGGCVRLTPAPRAVITANTIATSIVARHRHHRYHRQVCVGACEIWRVWSLEILHSLR